MKYLPFNQLLECAGLELGVSDWLDIDQARVNTFATATGDFQWIHVDVERASRELGGTLVHGFLTLSLIPVLSEGLMHVVGATRALNYGVEKVRFVNPVKVGARVRLKITLLGAEPRSGGVLVRSGCTVEIENEERPACVAETMALYFNS